MIKITGDGNCFLVMIGVDTEAEVETLRSLGIDLAQESRKFETTLPRNP